MTASVSEAELAALLADLMLPAQPLAAPAPDDSGVRWVIGGQQQAQAAAVQYVADLTADTAAKARNAGAPQAILDQLDGKASAAAAQVISAEPPAPRVIPDGPPPSTLAVMRDVLADLDASRPRSQQTRIGPSELGTPCQRQLAMKLGGVPRRLPDSRPAWAPMQGTAVHALMEEALHFHNAQLGYQRWVVEERLHMDDEISGSGDAFDLDTGTVVDWKLVGTTALREVKRKTIPNSQLVKDEYRVQAHVYGYGHERAGRDVRWVRLVFLARSHDFNDSAEWTEAYDADIAINALTRYYATQDLINGLDVAAHPDLWDLVPATPGKACTWCPFRRVGGPADGTGCPGDTQDQIDKQTAGLIAPAQSRRAAQ